jgi:DNA-binding NtrC family response regulator
MLCPEQLFNRGEEVKEILIVDDMRQNRELIREALNNLGYRLFEAENANDAMRMMQISAVDLVISDVRMPGRSGVELVQQMRSEHPDTTVVLITAFSSVGGAVDAMRAGAYDYVTRPVTPRDLRCLVKCALEAGATRKENCVGGYALDLKCGFEDMLGQSRALGQTLQQAARVAPTNATVLIQGETGTGKELLARGIHARSNRSAKPFVAVNCGAIPRDLIETTLFGHVRGSFTGAVMDRVGKVESANGGTLFLDEIGEFPLDSQAKLLRLLQQGEIEKVGAPSSTRVDVRIIAATHRCLRTMVENGTFREDLYYRLNVVPLKLPALRERIEDVPELVRFLFKRSCSKHGMRGVVLPEHLLSRFMAYSWPGNIRELENTVERIALLADGPKIGLADLPEFLGNGSDPNLNLPPDGINLDSLQRHLLHRALERCKWNQSQAARLLGLSRKTLIYRIRKYQIWPTPGALQRGACEMITEGKNQLALDEEVPGGTICP